MTINGDMELSVCTTQLVQLQTFMVHLGWKSNWRLKLESGLQKLESNCQITKHKRENMINYEVNYLVNLDMC